MVCFATGVVRIIVEARARLQFRLPAVLRLPCIQRMIVLEIHLGIRPQGLRAIQHMLFVGVLVALVQ